MARQDWLLIMALSILWGGSFLFVEIGLEALPPLTLVWLRVSLAALVLAAALPILRLPYPPAAAWPALVAMAVLNNALPFSLITLAQGQITGALASVLNATTPLFTLIVAHVATRDERITLPKAIGLGLGFAGVVVMLGAGALEGVLLAKLACLGAALSYGCAAVFGRRFRAMGVPPLATAFGMVAMASVLLAPLAAVVDRPWQLALPGTRVIFAVAALAVLSTALAYAIYFRVLARAGATNLSVVTFLIPVSATAMGAAVLGERLGPQHILGFGLICLGLAAIDRRISDRLWRRLPRDRARGPDVR